MINFLIKLIESFLLAAGFTVLGMYLIEFIGGPGIGPLMGIALAPIIFIIILVYKFFPNTPIDETELKEIKQKLKDDPEEQNSEPVEKQIDK